MNGISAIAPIKNRKNTISPLEAEHVRYLENTSLRQPHIIDNIRNISPLITLLLELYTSHLTIYQYIPSTSL